METDTLMAEASFFIRIENSHQEKTATPSVEKRNNRKRETVSGKKCKGCLPKEVPGNNGNGGLWYGCNTAENSNRQEYSGIIVGEGELGKIPGHLRPFLHVAGKLDFPAMYEAMRRADYFLPLLDPGNPAHNRYITTGVTGSAQLVYGFAKIPVIHEKFASFYGFNDRNALLYREETLGGAMLRAIRQTEEEYAGMQQALLQLGRDIDRESRSNLERALAACSPSEPQQARP